jgi:predicted transcriptional regulator
MTTKTGKRIFVTENGEVDIDNVSKGIPAIADTEVAVNDLVYLADDAGTLKCFKADNTANAAEGIVKSLDGANAIVVMTPEKAPLTSGIAAGSVLYLGTVGGITDTAPSESGEIVQKVGKVIDADTVLFNIQAGRMIV